ncbi:amidohydrolase family protein [Alteromonas sp. a30]|uniref:amidohydrolase family protein n=1 Tax=Alteromonas sp. a30 TaxID=2730917 RepID=UPI00227E3B76|nr:amidohydrolase family protein [Alteromonas sp. a30]MCY7296089.1 amidohydrolase family protein [Alteromonas sp. a30]
MFVNKFGNRLAALTAVISGSLTFGANASDEEIVNSYLFFGGNIITMSAEDYDSEIKPEAIWVYKDKIMSMGSKEKVYQDAKEQINADKMANLAILNGPEYPDKKPPPVTHKLNMYDLYGKTLMPGFVEPHTHLPLLISFSPVTDLSPCLPERYSYTTYDDDKINCAVNLSESINALNDSSKRELKALPSKKGWIMANGIDPSRLVASKISEIKPEKAEEPEGYVDGMITPKFFIDNPAKVIEDFVKGAKDNPVFILDQSGHVAYVNMQAFVEAGICSDVKTCSPKNMINDTTLPQNQKPALGTWVVDENGKHFTGKLLEEPAYRKFIQAIQENSGIKNSPFFFMPFSTEDEQGKANTVANNLLKKISKTGVTTMVNAGGMTSDELEYMKNFAISKEKNIYQMRFRSLISSEVIDTKGVVPPKADTTNSDSQKATPLDIANFYRTSVWEEDYAGLYGAYGIKWWADGSTQGCSAGLTDKYADKGLCGGTSLEEGMNYTDEQLYKSLKQYWGDWVIQVHANGDKAMQHSLCAFDKLHQERLMTSDPTKVQDMPIVFHHATVSGDPKTNENVIKDITAARNNTYKCPYNQKNKGLIAAYTNIQDKPKLDISVSHTPGHIAYWGGAFQNGETKGSIKTSNILGNPRAGALDAMAAEVAQHIPVSLHSDAPITPINPLWYVEQMVTRNTWFYPNLGDEDVQRMPPTSLFGDPKSDVYNALKAITIVPAQQNLLGNKIGTIEVGKVADLVILTENPLTVGKNKIHEIKAVQTFVNGSPVDWSQDYEDSYKDNKTAK